MVIVLIIVGLLVLIGVIYVLVRNSIIAERNRVDEAWSGIDVQLKRRHDLVPNLVESVKGYATHAPTFEKVTQARAAAMQASGPAGWAGWGCTGPGPWRLRVVAEQYPDLRATENFQQLQRQLSELEDEIQASRRIYSERQDYNDDPAVPDVDRREAGRLHRQAVLRDRRRRGTRGSAGLLHLGQDGSDLVPARAEAAAAAHRRVERLRLEGSPSRSGRAGAGRSDRLAWCGSRSSGRC